MTRKTFYFFGLTGRRITAFAVLTVAAAFFEGFGMAMFLPVLEFVEKGQDITVLAGSSRMWDYIIEVFSLTGVEVSLVTLLVVAVGLMLIRVVIMYARQVYSAWLTQQVLHTTRTNLFDGIIGVDYPAMGDQTSGGIINVLTTETQRVGGSFAALFTMLSNAMVMVGFLFVLLWLSVWLTLLALVFIGLAVAGAAYHVRHTRQYSHKATAANAGYSRMLLERLGAFRLVKLAAVGARESKVLRGASNNVRKQLYYLAKLKSSIDLIIEPLVLLAGAGIMLVAVNVLEMGLSEVGLFILILLRLMPLAKEVMRSRQSWHSCAGSVAAVLDGHAWALAHQEPESLGRVFSGVSHDISFEDVTFTYPGAERPALKNVTLTIPAGKVTALVGPSGSGKTTLADIIPRLRIPQQGRVLYDGVDGAEFDLATLRRGIAFVSQDAAILDDTVAENVRFPKPGATDVEIWQALERAQAREFVEALPQGLQTRLGERGTRLSGGQKQRLSLARALLQGTGVLILDEPTSALDSETERDIQKALDDLQSKGNITVVVIAHRLSTIRGADLIVVLKDGHVAEQGSHKQLMVSEDWYAKVSGMQVGTG